ncbi:MULTISPECIES: recombinase family protein [unclassified Colwellia]|uniref:recombinase family protein n=1 Tax=unclassified Colwellia TaxID=196834 RepID=UPI0015F393DB|nr:MULTISPECIES: recombinase family protein [unclassified Colwellia]MBA6379548.1 recombinase family protein [Colwellia sp. BRX10-7]MBA6386145.1 recombinase family protein [Colwellia sp. BRX10-2]MBA6403270.1 recombinase family protein [Colwellia sp. BRX10-5]MBA6405872.1 recombinase family protein [Colwellia sp. BRX10-1]
MKNKAYSYIRFSLKRQLQGGSLSRQQESVITYCDEHSLELDNELSFQDLGKSGFTGANLSTEAGLSLFINACEEGLVKKGGVLIIENFDRLTRQKVNVAVKLFLSLLEHVDIVTLHDKRRYTKDVEMTDLIMAIIIMSRAYEESETKSKRMRHQWDRKRENVSTVKLTKFCPFWLTLADDRTHFIVDKSRVTDVKHVFQLSIDGLGQSKIAEQLNKEGIPSSRGGTWASSSVRELLTNKMVLGHYQPKLRREGKTTPVGDVVPDYYPQVISEEMYYKSASSRNERKNAGSSKGGRRGDSFNNLLQGVAKCGKCDSPLHFVQKGKRKPNTKPQNYLVCCKAKVGRGCKYTSYRYEEIEQQILAMSYKLNSSYFTDPFLKPPEQDEQETLEAKQAKLDDLESNYEAYMDMITDYNSDATKRKVQQFTTNITKQKEEIDNFQVKTSGTYNYTDFITSFKTLNFEAKETNDYQHRAKLNRMLKKRFSNGITLNKADNTITLTTEGLVTTLDLDYKPC